MCDAGLSRVGPRGAGGLRGDLSNWSESRDVKLLWCPPFGAVGNVETSGADRSMGIRPSASPRLITRAKGWLLRTGICNRGVIVLRVFIASSRSSSIPVYIIHSNAK